MKYKAIFYLLSTYTLLTETSLSGEALQMTVEPITEKAPLPIISIEESNRQFTAATLLLKRGKTDAAIYKLNLLSETAPNKYKILLELGRISVGEKNWAHAIHVFKKAAQIRPKDIEVRLLLMDVYKAYQMPIQEIIAAKETLALDPTQLTVAIRLAKLYQEQAIHEEEIQIRRVVKKLAPDHYQNLKRLAHVFYLYSRLWESAKIYEQIKQYYPENVRDVRKLAALYAKLDERFYETLAYDHIKSQSESTGPEEKAAIQRIREKTTILDSHNAKIAYTNSSESTLDLNRYDSFADYTHLFTRSSFDFGAETKYSHLDYQGKNILAGNLSINSASLSFKGTQNWNGGDYILSGSAGLVYEHVSGKLFGRNSVLTQKDFPFLADSSFNSYGGIIPVGEISFSARPWVKEMFYRFEYQHGLVDELDARLNLLTQDKLSLSARYQSENMTEAQLIIDQSFVDDGNYRIHVKGSGHYILWGNGAMYDYRGKRQRFLRRPDYFIKAGYEIDYYKDDRFADNSLYETFVNSEFRHQGTLAGQALIYTFPSNYRAFLHMEFSYGAGTTLDYRKKALAKIIYYLPNSPNYLSLGYTYEDELSNNTTDNNLQIAGFVETHQLALNIKWHF